MKAARYIQIHDDMSEAIASGKWQPGDKIPAERDLAEEFSVSRMTLRQAIMLLVDEGLLERRVGAGTFVAEQKVQERLNGISSFTELMAAAGKVATSKTIAYYTGIATNAEIQHLKLAEGEAVLRMERIRYGDGEPIAYEIATLPEKLVVGLARQDLTDSLYRTLAEQRNIQVGKAQQRVTASAAVERIAQYLQIDRGDPVLSLGQVTLDQQGKPFEYVRTQYAGNRFEFYLEH